MEEIEQNTGRETIEEKSEKDIQEEMTCPCWERLRNLKNPGGREKCNAVVLQANTLLGPYCLKESTSLFLLTNNNFLCFHSWARAHNSVYHHKVSSMDIENNMLDVIETNQLIWFGYGRIAYQ